MGMPNLRWMSLCCAAMLLACRHQPTAQATQENAAPAYALEGTEVRTIRARQLQRDYQIYVSLPPSYKEGQKKYPVLFVTDAPYAFPLLRSIARRVGNHGKDLEEFILVGLSYAQGDTPEYSRRRDYTPSAGDERSAVSDMPGRPVRFGECEPYRRFIAEEVFPVVAERYRADMTRKIFAGHSYGSLLGAHILLTEPAMFDHYILGSPSFWFDHKVMFQREETYAKAHSDLSAHVFMGVGSFETVRPGQARYNQNDDLVKDMASFEKALASRKYPHLHITSTVIQDEDHLTVAPAILTRGLVWALGRQRSQ